MNLTKTDLVVTGVWDVTYLMNYDILGAGVCVGIPDPILRDC